MKINKLQWDSEFFGKEIGEVFLHENTMPDSEPLFDLIVVKQEHEFEVKIPGFEQKFQETKVNFIKEITTSHLHDFSQIKDSDMAPKNEIFFQELAYESGKHSRFLLDPFFGAIKFKELYNKWVENSLNKKFAEKVFYIEENLLAIGFVSLKKHNDIGKIGLIATHPDFQGKGLGRKLLAFAENYCFENKWKYLEIPTQKGNIPACGFYEKMGYTIKDELLIKHFWKKKEILC